MKHITRNLIAVLIVIVIGVTGINFAQEQPDLLTVPSNTMGELQSAQAIDSYFVEVTESQVISLEVLALTESLSPSFVMYNSDDEAMPIIADAMSEWGVELKVALPEAGLYRLIIGSLDTNAGAYMLRLNKLGNYSNHEYSLPVAAPTQALIEGNYQMHRYNFTAQSNHVQTLYVSSDIINPDVRLSLVNQTTLQEVGAMDMPVPASSFCIPAGTHNYTLDLMGGAGMAAGNYQLLLVSNTSENCEQTVPIAAASQEYGVSSPVAVNNGSRNSSAGTNAGESSESSAGSAGDSNDGTDDDGSGSNGDTDDGSTDGNGGTTDETATCGNGEVGVKACANVGLTNVDATVGADVNAGQTNVDATVDANVNTGQTNVDANANANVGQTNVDANVDANVNAGQTNVDANVNVGSDNGNPDLNVQADVNLGNLGVDAEVGISLPGQP